MKTIIKNEENLKDEQIEETVTRVKVFFINSNNEIMLASSAGGFQLPGGHVENGEKYSETIIREMKEETGITLNDNEVGEPFLCVDTLKKSSWSGKNRLSRILYFLIRSNKTPNINEINLTDNEKANNFCVKFVPYNDFYAVVNDIKCNNAYEANRSIASEILFSFEELKEYLNKK